MNAGQTCYQSELLCPKCHERLNGSGDKLWCVNLACTDNRIVKEEMDIINHDRQTRELL